MKRVYELDVYKLAEELSDMVWDDFDKWNKKVQNTVGYQQYKSMKTKFLISTFRERVHGFNERLRIRAHFLQAFTDGRR